MGRFDGKVAIVTGGGSGLGKAVAVKIAADGGRVVITGRRPEPCEAVVGAIKAAGGEAIYVRADVGRIADCEAMVAATVAKYGRLDVAVNNAGVAGPSNVPMADIEEAEWDDTLNINLKGVWMCMKFEIRAMLAGGGGSIVNVSSIYGLKGADGGHAPYCVSKHGLIGLSKTAAIDYADRNIRVNAVCPGIFRSELLDVAMEQAPEFIEALTRRHSAMNRVAEPAEVAEAVAFLCSDAASFVNGSAMVIDGGETTKAY